MVTIILDTAVLVDLYRNKRSTLDVLQPYKTSSFAITIFTYAEFLAGASLRHKIQARKFLSDYPIINFDSKSTTALKTLSMQHLLPAKHLADFLITATALANNAAIVTPNYKDFSKFQDLRVIKYDAGS